MEPEVEQQSCCPGLGGGENEELFFNGYRVSDGRMSAGGDGAEG